MAIYGMKNVQKSVGRVAEFCPICRSFKPCELFHTGVSATVYGVELGDGDTIGYEAVCLTCGVGVATHARKYHNVAEEGTPEDEILESCGPKRPEPYRVQMDMADKLNAGTLTPAERMKMMVDTFEFLNELARRRKSETTFDVKGSGGCSTSVTLFIALYLLWYAWVEFLPTSKPKGQYVFYFFCVLVAAGIAYTIGMIATDTKRYVQKDLLLKLALGLRPLKPTTPELEKLLAGFRKRKFTLARNLTLEQIEKALAG